MMKIDGSRMGRYYDELFEEIQAELYPGCNWISSLNFIAKLMHLKLKGKIPKNIFDELLKQLKFALPKENKIPATHYEAKRKLSRLGLGYQSIHIYESHRLGSLEHGDQLLPLASGSDHLAYSYEVGTVNGVRFVAYNRDKDRTTQNSGVLVAGTDGFNFYGQFEEILHISFNGSYSVVLFRYDYILANQAKQVFYLDDLVRGQNWKVVQNVNHRQVWDNILHESDEINDDVDIVHDTNSSNFELFVDLGDLVMQQSDQPRTPIVNVPQRSSIVKDDGDFIDYGEDGTTEGVEVTNDEDDLLIVYLSDEENDHVCSMDLNLISDDDSDYYT
uniref:Uncharacterized protein n=1 Tax=Cannabis sativa TaxID=3483 RepID=A0A803QNQ8_CANSA